MLIILAIIIIILYFLLQNTDFNSNIFYIFGFRNQVLPYEGEYFGLFPYLGYYLIGVVIGRCFYNEKKSYLKFLDNKIFSPINFIGKNSLIFYIIQFILIIIFKIILA